MSIPLLAFDIESIPDPAVGRRRGFEGTDAEVVRQMFDARLVETDGKSGYPQLPHHRIVTVGYARLDPESGAFDLGTTGALSPAGKAGGGSAPIPELVDEASVITGFFDLLGDSPSPPRLISWNGSGYDLPVIRYRSMLHGLSAPHFYRTDGDFRFNNYQSRFHDMHVDLMDVLSGYGASHRVGLNTLSELVGLPGKAFVEGEVFEHLFAGQADLVREYCKMDVLLTLLLYLNWDVHRGRLERALLRRWVDGIRGRLAEEAFEGWRGIVAALEGWPVWAR